MIPWINKIRLTHSWACPDNLEKLYGGFRVSHLKQNFVLYAKLVDDKMVATPTTVLVPAQPFPCWLPGNEDVSVTSWGVPKILRPAVNQKRTFYVTFQNMSLSVCFAFVLLTFILVHRCMCRNFNSHPATLSKTAPHPVPWQKKFAFSHRHVNRWPSHVEFMLTKNIKADLVLSRPQHPVFPIKPCNSKAKDISSTEISISFSRSRVLLSCFWACRCRVKRSALTKVSCSILCIQSLSNSEASTLKFRSSTKWKKWRFWYPTQKWRGWWIWRCSFCSAKFRVDILWKFLNFCLRKVKSYTYQVPGLWEDRASTLQVKDPPKLDNDRYETVNSAAS